MKARPRPFPKRALPYSRKVGIVVLKTIQEHSHNSTILHLSILDNQVKEELTHSRSLLEVTEPMILNHPAMGNMARE